MTTKNQTLGIDLGSNSLGWGLIDDAPETTQNLVAAGCYLYPLGVNLEKGVKEIAPNAGRQTARGMRKRGDRVRFRKLKLRELLKEVGFITGNEPVLLARELFALRKRGLDERLMLYELAAVLQHVNARRGFKSNRLADAKTEDKAKEAGVVKEGIAALKLAIGQSGARTLGEYFFMQFKESPEYNPDVPQKPIRARVRPDHNLRTSREIYREEIDLLWAKQKEFYPEVLTDELYNKIVVRTIFYQRPLKSKKHLIAKCRFETTKRCAMKAHPAAQEFRYWQKLADLRLTSPHEPARKLSLDEKLTLARKLETVEKLPRSKALKELNLGKGYKFNDDEAGDIPGNKTRARLRNALKDYYDELREQAYRTKSGAFVPVETVLWQALTYATDAEKLKKWAMKKLDLPEEIAEAYAKVNIEDDYTSMSARALEKILLKMKEEDLDYTQACAAVGYHHSHDEDIYGKDRKITQNIDEIKVSDKDLKKITSPVVRKAIAATMKIIRAVCRKFGKPDRIHIEMAREFKKTKEERENQRRNNNTINDRRKVYAEFLNQTVFAGKGDPIHPKSSVIEKFELWLELGLEKEFENEEEKKSFEEFLDKTKRIHITKHKLWLQQNRRSVYSGKLISLTELFSPNSQYQIEHIIPYSKGMDDSFTNKTLCEEWINIAKGDRTPYEYFQTKSNSSNDNYGWEQFKEAASRFPKGKRERLLTENLEDGFWNSQLRNTGWATRLLVRELKKHFRTVNVTNGRATSYLREKWGLDKLLANWKTIQNSSVTEKETIPNEGSNPDAKILSELGEKAKIDEKSKKTFENYKKVLKERGDHRHHTLDAIVIACTPKSLFQKMATEHAKEVETRKEISIPLPWGNSYQEFFNDVKDALAKTLIVYENRKKLFVPKKNKYIHSKSPNKKEQQTKSVRGALHEETNYGKIDNWHTKEAAFVVRQPLAWFDNKKKIERIIDPAIRNIVLERFESKNGGKDAFSEPLYAPSKKGYKIPIYRVRVADRADAEEENTSMVELRPKLFVKPGNNYLIAVYEKRGWNMKKKKEETKRACETVSFLEAVKRKQRGELIYPPIKEGLPLRCTLTHNEMVVVLDADTKTVDWNDQVYLFNRLYRVIKFSGNNIYLGKHNRAKIEADKDPEPLKLKRSATSVDSFRFVKVRMTLTGEVIPLEEIRK